MANNIYIYTVDDLDAPPNVLTTGAANIPVAATASPDILSINDDDPLLDPLTSGDGGQLLAADLIINGITVGYAGQTVSIYKESTLTNFTASFQQGTVSTISVNGSVVGFVSTILLSPGDTVTIEPATTGQAIDYRAFAACFTRDTKILCVHGELRVQDLQSSDRVITRHNGPQPIRWVGSHKAKAQGVLAPVCFKAGALGNSADILVSPMHRMLISGPRAEVLFGVPELLACAKDLRDGDRIFSAPCVEVEYFHILFDTHQIISAHGCWSESFAPHHEAINAFEHQARDEILKLFPELDAGWQDALPTLSTPEAEMLSNPKHSAANAPAPTG